MKASRLTHTVGMILLMAALVLPGLIAAAEGRGIRAGMTASAPHARALPDGREPLTFRGIGRHTDFGLEKDGDADAVEAVSDRSASGRVRPLSIDPTEYPVIEWRWKVENTLARGTSTAGREMTARRASTSPWPSIPHGSATWRA